MVLLVRMQPTMTCPEQVQLSRGRRGLAHTARREYLDRYRSARVGLGVAVVFLAAVCLAGGNVQPEAAPGPALAQSRTHAKPHRLLRRRRTPVMALRNGQCSGTKRAGCDRDNRCGATASPGKRRPGHGRQGAETYRGAEHVVCHHETLAAGERCPVCGRGRLYRVTPGVEIRLDGHALLSAVRYVLEKFRCSACGQVFTASAPAEAGADKYSARARAVLVLGRYYLGCPSTGWRGIKRW